MKIANNIIDNKVRKYTDIMYDSGPKSFNDFTSDKMDNIHKQLYTEAINEWLTSYITEYKDKNNLEDSVDNLKTTYLMTHKFIEHKDYEFDVPSTVSIISTTYPYRKYILDLTDYWDNYIYDENNKDLSNLNINEDSTRDAEVIYINYVSGKAKFKSKYTGETFWAPIKYITEDTVFNKDEMTLENTFTYKLNNQIYGE